MPYLEKLAGESLGRTIFLTGRVGRAQVPHYLAAMDLASLPQSVDEVGSFRYTTKLPEYRRMRLPLITNQIPMAYDLDRGDTIRLRGANPWSEEFLNDLAELMQSTSQEDVTQLQPGADQGDVFERESQIARLSKFLIDILISLDGSKR
jgi:hypothetical protein